MAEIISKRRKLLLLNLLSPGDIVMMTAAVRDLHRAHPGRFITDVFTSVGSIWDNNPYITKLPFKVEALGEQTEPAHPREILVPTRKLKFTIEDPDIEVLDCGYDGNFPGSINYSNQNAYHFIHGYAHDLERKLGVTIPVTEFKGDIHISEAERGWMSQIQELGIQNDFWLIFSGGKYDFTAKWWNPASYQEVVNRFKGKITFVQCGDPSHFHPPLENVINLIGKTDARQLIRLVYHSNGVICPVTFAMHLAAAVPMRTYDTAGRVLPPHRPCVVLGGGREAYHWEAYPHHQYIHTIGALPCCSGGGCWKSRCQKVGDNDHKDENTCLYPVQVSETLQIGKCQTMITPDMVCERVSMYYDGGLFRYNDVSPWAVRVESTRDQGARLAQYLVERFRPSLMLDIGCRLPELLQSVFASGVDVYGVREDTKLVFVEEEFPRARISLCDLSQQYWQSPTKFDLIWTTSAIDHAGSSAKNLCDTITKNIKAGGVLVITPPPDYRFTTTAWAEQWLERLTEAGFILLNEETDKLRRLTHRVGHKGVEFVFMRPAY